MGYRPPKRDYVGKVHTFVSSEGECPFNAHAPILRTDVVRNIGGFDEAMRSGGEDWDLWQRLMRHGYWFEPVHRIAAIYRRKKGSMVRSMPLEHLNAGQHIFDWVHAPLPPHEIVPGTPFVFDKGLDVYRRQTRFLQRAVQYGAMVFLRDKAEFEHFLSRIPGHLWPYALKQFDVARIVTSGLLRFLAVDDAVAADLGSDLTEARDAVLAHYQAAAARNRPSDEPQLRRLPIDVALFAANPKQAASMAGLAERLAVAGRSHCLVGVEAVSGDQGVEDLWKTKGLPWQSHNAYRLKPAW
ncbi:glycosyltransferase family 2 protein, partial [Rhizobiaceae sp. 2RAB30]